MSSIRRRPDLPSDEVYSITSAPEPLADDMARRQKRYLAQMAVRVVCFAASVITWGRIPMWVSLLLLVAAVVLPYSAVLLANAGRERRESDGSFMSAREIGPGSGAPRGLQGSGLPSDGPEGRA